MMETHGKRRKVWIKNERPYQMANVGDRDGYECFCTVYSESVRDEAGSGDDHSRLFIVSD